MILRIDQTSPDPVYLQICDQIVGAIARGELLPADRLPSVRALASDLGVNLHTVNKAYAVLRDEGYLFMRGRSGATVADYRQVATPERKASNVERLASELHRLALEHRAQGGTEESFLAEARAQAGIVFAGSATADPAAAGSGSAVPGASSPAVADPAAAGPGGSQPADPGSDLPANQSTDRPGKE